MRLLLDTHVVVWAAADPVAFEPFRQVLSDDATELFVSAVVPWELAIKVGTGKLALAVSASEFVSRFAASWRATELPIRWSHAGEVQHLPRLHGDPFDRLLVAQARVEGLALATVDPLVRSYDVAVFP